MQWGGGWFGECFEVEGVVLCCQEEVDGEGNGKERCRGRGRGGGDLFAYEGYAGYSWEMGHGDDACGGELKAFKTIGGLVVIVDCGYSSDEFSPRLKDARYSPGSSTDPVAKIVTYCYNQSKGFLSYRSMWCSPSHDGP